jgi:signal transduction histidine kinase
MRNTSAFLAARGDFGAGVDTAEQIRGLVASAGQPYGYERTRPDGRVIEIRRNPVPGGGFVLIFSDITERKRSEAEIGAARDAVEAALHELKAAQANLIQAEKMASLGQLTAGIAHEIKNPLNFVNNFAELSVDLLGELKDAITPAVAALNQDQRDEVDEVGTTLTSNLEKITEHGKRADGIVKAMLEHSRGSSAERRMVDLTAVIDEALNLAYHGARAQDQSFTITLDRDFAEGMAPIEVNPQDMTRVFLNIFSNGFYAATRRARNGGDAGFVPLLMVTTRDSGEAVEIRVRDNGTGIPAEIRDKLLQPFFTTKPTGEGTGLGLSITYDIVTKQHGGTITVESEVDAFTQFVVTLPRKMFTNGGGRA